MFVNQLSENRLILCSVSGQRGQSCIKGKKCFMLHGQKSFMSGKDDHIVIMCQQLCLGKRALCLAKMII